MNLVMLEQLITVIGGGVAFLYGFRFIGPQVGTNQKYDRYHMIWGKYLKWLGSILIVFGLVQVFNHTSNQEKLAGTFDRNKVLSEIEKSQSEYSVKSVIDGLYKSEEGYKVYMPESFTYSVPDVPQVRLIAQYNQNNLNTPAFAVMIFELNDSDFETTVNELFNQLKVKNETTTFSKYEKVKVRGYSIIKAKMESTRDAGVVKGGMVCFTKNGMLFYLNYGTLAELYDEHEKLLEEIAMSFLPN